MTPVLICQFPPDSTLPFHVLLEIIISPPSPSTTATRSKPNQVKQFLFLFLLSIMLEESIPAAWATLNSWFTPTLLFVFLNLMIGTIAIASGLGTQKQPQTPDAQPQQLARAPSVLQRIKSINLYRYRSQDLTPFSSITTTTLHPPDQSEHTQYTLDSFREEDPPAVPTTTEAPYQESESESEIEREAEAETETPAFHNMEEDHRVERTLSDTNPASGRMPVKLPKKMRKSASTKSPFSHFEEVEVAEVLRPATVREGKSDFPSFGEDEEVDAKADDFINKFKQQLKLQRLDSILRYKEMLGRGAEK